MSNILIIKRTSKKELQTGQLTPQVNNSSSSFYDHIQSMPASQWIINHGLGFNPNVTVVDSAGENVIGDIDYVNTSSLKINFGGAFSGKAYLS